MRPSNLGGSPDWRGLAPRTPSQAADTFGNAREGGATVGRTYTVTFDPATNSSSERTVTESGHNMFCPGTTNLADGRLLVNCGISR